MYPPIGFMFATGNENKKNWTKMLRCLQQAFPIISETQKTFCVCSDCDKSPKPALQEVFPDNSETSCAYHIQANVKQKFGDACSTHCQRFLDAPTLENAVTMAVANIPPSQAALFS
jgi:hypothetical protein